MGIRETFEVLRGAKSDYAIPAISAGLASGDERIVLAAVDVLAHSKSAIGFAKLLEHYNALPKKAQDIVSASIYRLRDLAEEIIRGGSDGMRATMLRLLEKNTSVDTLGLLPYFLNSDDAAVRERAALAFDNAIHRFADDKSESEGDVRNVTRRISSAVRSTERIRTDLKLALDAINKALETLAFHRSPVVVRAAFVLGSEGSSLLFDALKRDASVASVRGAVVDILKADNTPEAFGFLYALVASDMDYFRKIGNAILAAKSGPEAMQGAQIALETLELSQQRRVFRLNSGVPWLGIFGKNIDRLGTDYHDFLYREIERMEVDSYLKIPTYALLAYSTVADVRKGSIAALIRTSHPTAREALSALLASGEENLLLEICSAMADAQYPDIYRILAPLLVHPNDNVRRLATHYMAQKNFDKFVLMFDQLDPETRAMAGEAVRGLDERGIEHLELELKNVDPEKRLRAIRIIQATGTKGKMGKLILELVKDPDKKVRSTIIQLLSVMKNAEAIKALIGLLSDPDPRVQANAVEAVEALRNPEFRKVLIPFLKSPHNRTRGNACKALWTLGMLDVAKVMFVMLRDHDPLMRMTGTWVIGETNPEGGIQHLQEALVTEADEGVRTRMRAVIEKLSVANAQS